MLAEMVPGQFRRSKGDGGGAEQFGDATGLHLYDHESTAMIVDLSEAREIAALVPEGKLNHAWKVARSRGTQVRLHIMGRFGTYYQG